MRFKLVLSLAFAGLIIGVMVMVSAQDANTWQRVGLRGLIVFSVLIDPNDDQTLFVGSNAGLLKSDDGGNQFARVLGGLPRDQIVMQVRFDPNDAQTLYAATGNGGLYRSQDGAATWSRVVDIPQRPLGLVTIDPADSDRIFVATFGQGVFRSTDGGQTFQAINVGLNSQFSRVARPILIDPNDPQTLYLGTDGAGIFRSDDGGDTWRPFNQGLGFQAVPLLIFDPTDTTRILAGTDSDGVFLTEDKAQRWKRKLGAFHAFFTVSAIWSKRTPQLIFLGSRGNGRGLGGGVLISQDGGQSFEEFDAGLSNQAVHSLAQDPQDSTVLYAGTEDGLFRLKLSL